MRKLSLVRFGLVNPAMLISFVLIGGLASCCFVFLIQTPTPLVETGLEKKAIATKGNNANSDHLFSINIRQPEGPPRVETGLTGADGKALTVSCSTCHATRLPNFENKTVADLDEFHKTIKFSHGSTSCLSCHNSNDYDSLKLADGSRIEFSNVMTLCGQCHGPQMKDFEHGAHGGMTGFWDRKLGPQSKNNCVDCHSPHSPRLPKMQPTFKPRDRFLKH